MTQTRMTIVLSRTPGQHPARRAIEDELATLLATVPAVGILVIPHLYDLPAHHPAMEQLRSVAGNLVVLAWLYPGPRIGCLTATTSKAVPVKRNWASRVRKAQRLRRWTLPPQSPLSAAFTVWICATTMKQAASLRRSSESSPSTREPPDGSSSRFPARQTPVSTLSPQTAMLASNRHRSDAGIR